MTEETIPQVVEDDADILALLPTLSGLQQRYMALRLIEPDRPVSDILLELNIPPTAAASWFFPAEIEFALARTIPGIKDALAKNILEQHAPKAALTLVKRLDSENEKVAMDAAVKILGTRGITPNSIPTGDTTQAMSFTLNIGDAMPTPESTEAEYEVVVGDHDYDN